MKKRIRQESHVNNLEEQFHYENVDFEKMRVGLRTLDDAVINLSSYKHVNPNYADKVRILQAIKEKDLPFLREVSDYFFSASGLYERFCTYLARLYRYDWYVSTQYQDSAAETNILKDFAKVLQYFDASDVKLVLNDIALEVVKTGVYYGYILDFNSYFSLQQLPAAYCRSQFKKGNLPAVELNLAFFDKQFTNVDTRIKVLKAFPKEIQKAYVLYKEGKLQGTGMNDKGWYLLDPEMTVKFNLNNNDIPPLMSVIPAIIDLDKAQELDRKKTMQQLLKILIQKLPLDKNNELIFDMEEAQDIHNNAVHMLRRAVGMDVLTTFCDVDIADTKDNNSNTTKDDLQKVERAVFNASGMSYNLFNSEGSAALEKSVLNDESFMLPLKLQFERFLNRIVKKFKKPKYHFVISMLPTTSNNYVDMSKVYKEQVQIGYSKMLPQIALGHSQSSILAGIQFENNILKLSDIMIPPLSSNTISAKDMIGRRQGNTDQTSGETAQAGRPEKDISEKSEKTIANKESQK